MILDIEGTIKIGKKCGYPDCCIFAFISDILQDVSPVESRKQEFVGLEEIIRDTGFVPCQKHSRLLLNKQITFKKIIKNRQVKEPFPEYNV